MRNRRKRLSINLPHFSLPDNFSKSPVPNKSPNKFESPDGVVGLGIVAAISDNQITNNKAAILAISPRPTSIPIPILSNNSCNANKNKQQPSIEEMVMCEEYTRVISLEGTDLVRKREYFDDRFLGNAYHKATSASIQTFMAADFLNTCSFCRKHLQGLDIFIYRFAKMISFVGDAEERRHFVAQSVVASKSQ